MGDVYNKRERGTLLQLITNSSTQNGRKETEDLCAFLKKIELFPTSLKNPSVKLYFRLTF